MIKNCLVIAQQHAGYTRVCRRYCSRWVLAVSGNECVVGKKFGVGEVVGENVVEDNKESYSVGTDSGNLF